MIKNNGRSRSRQWSEKENGSGIGARESLMSIDYKRGQEHGKGKTSTNFSNHLKKNIQIGIIAYFNQHPLILPLHCILASNMPKFFQFGLLLLAWSCCHQSPKRGRLLGKWALSLVLSSLSLVLVVDVTTRAMGLIFVQVYLCKSQGAKDGLGGANTSKEDLKEHKRAPKPSPVSNLS